jgi:hypothetical protein
VQARYSAGAEPEGEGNDEVFVPSIRTKCDHITEINLLQTIAVCATGRFDLTFFKIRHIVARGKVNGVCVLIK